MSEWTTSDGSLWTRSVTTGCRQPSVSQRCARAAGLGLRRELSTMEFSTMELSAMEFSTMEGPVCRYDASCPRGYRTEGLGSYFLRSSGSASTTETSFRATADSAT